MSVEIKYDEWDEMICPTCKDGRLYFNHDHVAIEVESWVCTECPAEFHVDIEINRDWDNVREVKNNVSINN